MAYSTYALEKSTWNLKMMAGKKYVADFNMGGFLLSSR